MFLPSIQIIVFFALSVGIKRVLLSTASNKKHSLLPSTNNIIYVQRTIRKEPYIILLYFYLYEDL